jgi:hypothetical protein
MLLGDAGAAMASRNDIVARLLQRSDSTTCTIL